MTDMNPLVSIIVPTFNSSKFITDCINSILNQTYKNIELIIVDDNSDDDTVMILKDSLCDSVVPYQLIQNTENHGVSYSRNIGIKRALGEIISFVDSDDIISNKMIEILVSVFLSGDYSVTRCECCFFINDNIDFDKDRNPSISIQQTVLDDENYIFKNVFKRTLFEKVSFDEKIRFGEDDLFFLRLAKYVKEVPCVNMKLYAYRNNPYSVTAMLWKNEKNAIKAYEVAKEGFSLLHDIKAKNNRDYLSTVIRFCRIHKNSIFGYLYASNCKKNNLSTSELIIPINLIIQSNLSIPQKVYHLLFRFLPFIDTYQFFVLINKVKQLVKK